MVEERFSTISGDLQGLNTYRYARNITGGIQELMEALVFKHYLETQTLITYDDASSALVKLGSEGGSIGLSVDDYLLGIYDMTGELMRFAINNMATSGAMPGVSTSQRSMQSTEMDQDGAPSRSTLDDMRELRSLLESLDIDRSPLGRDAEKKAEVTRQSVEKVEKAMYGLIVRGSERPKGWVPSVEQEATEAVAY